MKAAESSTVVAFRALVMLACLVVAPLAAIFGSAFPDVVRAWLINPLLAHTEAAPTGFDSPGRPIGSVNSSPVPPYANETNTADRSPEGQAPFWQPPAMTSSASGPGPGAASPNGNSALSPASTSIGSGQPAGAGGGGTPPFSPPPHPGAPAGKSPAPPRGARQAAFSARVDAASPSAAGDAAQSRFATATGDPVGHAQGSAGAGSASSAAGGSVYSAAPNVQPAAQPAAQPASQNEQFAWFEKKLREHGAAYYLLETWGNDGELYRFHCKMTVAGNPNYTRHFEATDHDKLQAMAKVLEQVEAWRGGRLP